MDVYDYPAYQYNQSDELAKQMFAQQTLSGSVPVNRGITDPHVMPEPSGAPWNPQRLSWGLTTPPQVVQFTGQSPTEPKISSVIHCKRKSLDVEPVIPAKQLITEEKMAAHLNSLHISSDFTSHNWSQDSMDADMSIDNSSQSLNTSNADIGERLKGHTIVLSDVVKKLKDEPLLPASLIESLEKPRMSLVVWKPKENILDKLKEVDEKDNSKTEQEEEPKKRNGVLVMEFPTMDIEM